MSAYDIVCPEEPTGVIGPGFECIDDDEVESLSHVHFRVDTNGGWGDIDVEVEELDPGVPLVWHTSSFFVESGQRHWIGRITLSDPEACGNQGVLRLRITAVGNYGSEMKTVARLKHEGDCTDGEIRLLNGAQFDPTIVYYNDQGQSTG